MGTRRAFGTVEIIIILVILGLLAWLLFAARSGKAGSSLPPGIEEAVRWSDAGDAGCRELLPRAGVE